MKRLVLVLVVVALVMGVMAAPAAAPPGNGAFVDRANDCKFEIPIFPLSLFTATDLRVQKVKTPVDSGQFHCHGKIDNLENAPSKAFKISGPGCTVPAFFGERVGFGRVVVTPNGHINLTCHFSQPPSP